MKITINIEKTHAIMIMVLMICLTGALLADAQTIAAAFKPNLGGFHQLKFIAQDKNGEVSVDANQNGIIDNSEDSKALGGNPASYYVAKTGLDKAQKFIATVDANNNIKVDDTEKFGGKLPADYALTATLNTLAASLPITYVKLADLTTVKSDVRKNWGKSCAGKTVMMGFRIDGSIICR